MSWHVNMPSRNRQVRPTHKEHQLNASSRRRTRPSILFGRHASLCFIDRRLLSGPDASLTTHRHRLWLGQDTPAEAAFQTHAATPDGRSLQSVLRNLGSNEGFSRSHLAIVCGIASACVRIEAVLNSRPLPGTTRLRRLQRNKACGDTLPAYSATLA
jgi:hypothetical protein